MFLNKWKETAVKIIGDMETNGNAWGCCNGNFDGMGLSCGILQWNIGSGTQQPLVEKYIANYKLESLIQLMPKNGTFYHNMILLPLIESVKRLGDMFRINPDFRNELRAFWQSSGMRVIQSDAIDPLLNDGYNLAKSMRLGIGLHEICYFCDIIVNQGTMKGIDRNALEDFIGRCGDLDAAVALVMNWCDHNNKTCNNLLNSKHVWDKLIDANKVSQISKKLFVLSWMRITKGKRKFQPVIMARKGILSLGTGYYESELKDYRKELGI